VKEKKTPQCVYDCGQNPLLKGVLTSFVIGDASWMFVVPL